MLTTNLTMALSQVVTLFGSVVDRAHHERPLYPVHPGAAAGDDLVVAFVFGSRIQKGSTQVQDQLAASTVVAEEGLQGIRVVKSFGREGYETQRYDNAMDQTFSASLRMAVYNSLFGSVMMFLGFGTHRRHHVVWRARGHRRAADAGDDHRLPDVRHLDCHQPGWVGRAVRADQRGDRRRAPVFEMLDTSPTCRMRPTPSSCRLCAARSASRTSRFSYDGETPRAAGRLA